MATAWNIGPLPGEPPGARPQPSSDPRIVPHLLRTLRVGLEAAVLEVDARAPLALGGEAHLDLGVEARVVPPRGRQHESK
jgi:hypothetical protein